MNLYKSNNWEMGRVIRSQRRGNQKGIFKTYGHLRMAKP